MYQSISIHTKISFYKYPDIFLYIPRYIDAHDRDLHIKATEPRYTPQRPKYRRWT